MIIALSVDTITDYGAIPAAGFTITGPSTLGSTNTGLLYVSTLMQSAGTISVGTLSGSTWTDTCKLEANGDGTFAGGITTAGGIVSNYGNITAYTGSISSFGKNTSFNGSITASQGNIGGNHVVNFYYNSYRICNMRLYINIRVCISSTGCGYR